MAVHAILLSGHNNLLCRRGNGTGHRSDFQYHGKINTTQIISFNCSTKFLPFFQNGSAVGPLLIAPFLGLAIYGFDFAADIPALMYALMKLSYIRVGAVTLVLSVFGFNRPELDCNEMYCHFSDPKVLLRFLRVEKVSIWHEFGFLVLLLLFFRVMLFLSLKKRCRT